MFHAVSPAVPGEATARVEQSATAEGWRLHVFDAGEFADEAYIANPVNRRYFCKASPVWWHRSAYRRADPFRYKSR